MVILNLNFLNTSIHILITVLLAFPMVMTRRICLTIKSFFSWWYSPYSINLNVWFGDDIVGRNMMLVSRVIDTTFINSYLVLSKINSAMEQQLSRVHHVISWFILMSSFHPTSYVRKKLSCQWFCLKLFFLLNFLPTITGLMFWCFWKCIQWVSLNFRTYCQVKVSCSQTCFNCHINHRVSGFEGDESLGPKLILDAWILPKGGHDSWIYEPAWGVIYLLNICDQWIFFLSVKTSILPWILTNKKRD